MSLRELVDPECGGANPLMRLGAHLTNDIAHKDDGISGHSFNTSPNTRAQHAFGELSESHLVDEFLGQMSAPPPQSFRMDRLLQEMREIDAANCSGEVIQAPLVSAELSSNWADEFGDKHAVASMSQPTSTAVPAFGSNAMAPPQLSGEQFWQNQAMHTKPSIAPPPPAPLTTAEFFDTPVAHTHHRSAPLHASTNGLSSEQLTYSEFMRFMNKVGDGENSQHLTDTWSELTGQTEEPDAAVAPPPPAAASAPVASAAAAPSTSAANQEADWVRDFAEHKTMQDIDNDEFQKQFWNRLQDEWKRMSERMEGQSPWLSEFSEYYDPYREYSFDEENPMLDMDNVFEKGKSFMQHGDIPSAVLCFEAAVRQDENNAEIWELLGTCQAENEKDPNAIAALKRSHELQPNNPKVLMALAISYTNESLQNQALRMLIDWLRSNEKYENLVPEQFRQNPDAMLASSLINGPALNDVQSLFIQAVQQSPHEIDADIQEALGVLFNLSSDYDKAADCFRAALQIRPSSAKLWNRLGASLANGNQAVEAVDAYQHALDIEPGYIRARYNVGIICINLKAHNEAVEHFLLALNHQAKSMERSGQQSVATSRNQMSDTIWSTLRMVISLMGRNDLQEAIDQRNLDVLNREFKTSD